MLADEDAYSATISGDGTHVAFITGASNLGAGSGSDRLYVKDLTTGALELASRRTGADGVIADGYTAGPSLTTDGAKVAFHTSAVLDPGHDVNAVTDVYVRDLGADTTTLISRPSGDANTLPLESLEAMISGNGATVVFRTLNAYDILKDANGGGSGFDIYARTGAATVLVSRADGANTSTGAGAAQLPSITADGGRVAFSSAAPDLVPGDANGFVDVFVRNLAMNTTQLVSRPDASAAGQGNGSSFYAQISAQGGRVSFYSFASNLVPGVNAGGYTYVRTIATDETRVAAQLDGGPASVYVGVSLSGDGLVAAFDSFGIEAPPSPGPDFTQTYVSEGDVTELVSGPTGSTIPAAAVNDAEMPTGGTVSADGRFVVFASGSDGLSTADNDRFINVFLRDTVTGETTVVAGESNAGAGSPAISADGRKVAIYTNGTNLPGNPANGGVYVWDRQTSALTLVQAGAYDVSLSADGSRVAFVTAAALDAGADANADSDVYVHDVAAGTTTLASRADGAGTNAGDAGAFEPSLSADGTRVAFSTGATDLGDGDSGATFDIHVRDLAVNTTVLASRADGAGGDVGNSGSSEPSLSGDGNRVAFRSLATNLGDGDTTAAADIHVRDVAGQTTVLASREGSAGGAGTGDSEMAAISADGTKVAFATRAPNLHPAAADARQILVRDLGAGVSTVASVAEGAAGAAGNAASRNPSLTADGGCVVFATRATGLEPDGYASPDFRHLHMRVLSGTCGELPVVATPTATPTATPPGPAADTTAPVVRILKVKRRFVRLRLSEAARVKVKVRGRRAVTRALGAGRRKVRVRRLKRGRHRVSVVATDAAGNVSPTIRKRVRIRR